MVRHPYRDIQTTMTNLQTIIGYVTTIATIKGIRDNMNAIVRDATETLDDIAFEDVSSPDHDTTLAEMYDCAVNDLRDALQMRDRADALLLETLAELVNFIPAVRNA